MNNLRIRGAGGGSEGKAHTPVEAPNTLQNAVKGKILDLIAFGPIFGLVDGLKSVYLDSTPVQNADDTFNFSGVVLETREGHPDQEMISGFAAIENTIEVGTEILFDNPPVRSVSNNDANAVLVMVQVAALVKQETNGDAVAASVTIFVDYRQGSAPWELAASYTASGKTTAPLPISIRVNLPRTGGPFQIRVRRGNKESDTQDLRDQVNWTYLTEVIDRRMSYPYMAMCGITVDARLFGNQLPPRSYDVKLSIINIPSNYDPITREYTGIWDGTFKKDWSDNPAWAYYDLATHPIIGADIKNVDKWVLYHIGQYCDELVENGYGGMEPRFSINTVFADQEDAIQALNTLATAFRGMSYWGTDTVVAVADMPSTPVKIVSPANVVDGDLEYSGTSMRERHSVAIVMWNDPANEDKSVPEVYEDADSIVEFGWRETRATAVGCNSRGQALRLAKWILYSERMETQSLSYKAVDDHANLRPGQIIQVADPDYQGARMSGRVITGTTTAVRLDAVPTEAIESTTASWYLSVLMPDGTIAQSEVSTFNGSLVNLVLALPSEPIDGAMWALFSVDLELPQFKVVSVNEGDDGTYSILATEHDPRKYDIVEKDLVLPPRPTSLLPTGPVLPPLDLSFEVYTYYAGGSLHQGVTISWTPARDARVSTYVLDVMSPSDAGFRTVYNDAGLSFDLRDVRGGQWTIRVRAVASTGVPSQWMTRTVQFANMLLPVPPDSIKVTEKTFEVTLTPISAYPSQLWEFWRSNVPLSATEIETNATQLPTGTYLVDVGLRAGRTYFYYVRGTNQYGKSTWFATQATTLEDYDDILAAVTKEIKEGDLYIWLNSEITTVATNVAEQVALEVATEIVDQKVAELQEQIDNLVDVLLYDPGKSYSKDETVRVGNMLWQAVTAVPADPTGANGPPNPTYWINVGQIIDDVNGLAAEVDQVKVSLADVDGRATSTAEQVYGLIAERRDDSGEGALGDALDGARSRASFQQRIRAVAQDGYATGERLTVLSAEVKGNKASITDLDVVVATEKQATATRISQINSNIDQVQANLTTEQSTRASETAANAQAITNLNTDYQGNKASVQTSLTSLSTATSTNAQQLTTLRTEYEANAALVQTQITTLSTSQGSQAQQISILRAEYEANAAYVQGQISAHSTDIQAQAQAITTLRAEYEANSATVQSQFVAQGNALTSQAQAITTLQATSGDHTTMIQTNANAVANLNGAISATYGIKIQAVGDGRVYTAGMGINLTSAGGITQSEILFQADRFALINMTSGVAAFPFLIDSGTVYMNTVMIKSGSIDFLKISDTLQSTNYVAGQSGWKLWKNGTFELNGPVAGGGRMYITNQVIMVYDANGVLRVRLGIWA